MRELGLEATTGTGALLMGHGLSMTTYHAQDIKMSNVSWKNTNPFDGPVGEDVIAVDEEGNAIKVPEGNPTGTRKDGGHKPGPKHPDPRAWSPHGHAPGVTNPDGTPWLPIY